MLTPKASLQIGNFLYDSQAVALKLRRGYLPVVDRLEVFFPTDVQLDVSPGDDVELKLDGGEGEETVFTGKLGDVAIGLRGARVVCHGGALDLARYRPALSLEKITVGDIVKRFCADAGVDTGDVADGPTLALYAADGRETALAEIARLGRHLGAEAAFTGDGALHLFTVGSDDAGPAPDLAIKYGREVVAVAVDRLRPDDASRTVIGEGAGAPSSSRARWPIVDFFGGSGDAPGPAARRRAAPELRTVDDARAASDAWADRQQARAQRVTLATWLLPKLAPGGRLQIQELPDGLGLSACRIEQVVHVIDGARGASTQVWAREGAGGSGGGAGGLLGAAGAAIAGALA